MDGLWNAKADANGAAKNWRLNTGSVSACSEDNQPSTK